MESNDKIKEIDIKNYPCYYFVLLYYDTINIEDFHTDNILIDEKPYKIILVYNISYKTLKLYLYALDSIN